MTLHFLTGLPRTGSTLLASLLYQNPLIHTEGASVLNDLMWEVQNVYLDNPNAKASRKKEVLERILRNLPHEYYAGVGRPVVFDKSFTWTLGGNIEMAKKYITDTPKFIVLHRPTEEIVRSFIGLMERGGSYGVFKNGIEQATGSLHERMEHSILNGSLKLNLEALQYVRSLPDQSPFHYVEYKDLIENTQEVLNGIYKFIELPQFTHDLESITNAHPEDDTVWGLPDMHAVRPVISERPWQQ